MQSCASPAAERKLATNTPSTCMLASLVLMAWLGLSAIASAETTTSPIRKTGDWVRTYISR